MGLFLSYTYFISSYICHSYQRQVYTVQEKCKYRKCVAKATLFTEYFIRFLSLHFIGLPDLVLVGP